LSKKNATVQKMGAIANQPACYNCYLQCTDFSQTVARTRAAGALRIVIDKHVTQRWQAHKTAAERAKST